MPSRPPHKSPPLYYERERKWGKISSVVLHILFLLFSVLGLPSFFSPPPPEEPPSISVDILPISAISNVKPSEPPPAPEEKPKDTPPPETKPEEKAAEAKKPSPPVKTEEPPPPPPPVEKVAEKPPEPKKPDVPKPEPKKPEKPKPKPKPKDDDLAAVLKAVKETAQKEAKKEKKDDKAKAAPDSSNNKEKNRNISSHYNADLPMSMSERDAIMSQLAKCWSVPAGAKDAQNLVVVIDAEYNKDGSYVKVVLASESLARYNSDTFFRAAADSALRAVKECSPLKNLPPEKYDTWRAMELRFDPKFMLN